jgi:hypothetical protein
MVDGSYYAPKKPAAPAGSLDQGKIFVGGLSWQTTEESPRWHFEQYGASLFHFLVYRTVVFLHVV